LSSAAVFAWTCGAIQSWRCPYGPS